ncbi:hypothetical protein NCAS_0A14650 [Naumovozyma castellii]|uniref:Cyclin-like domain-containing protein n=1 Tax=Naumovozyma castellii TaxID=27288 RepID=G0V973_NAUCA|nr:hypothetical protein NCAS_0A14650 [Naumovozyma castellii CBS 4309]CCC68023.1 hypothetical protein NCAS_0A14650 [Naumovozyma castellii CBS 4309]
MSNPIVMHDEVPVETTSVDLTTGPEETTPDATIDDEEENIEDNKPPNYKRISDDDLYRHSSQYRFWSFSKERLREKRVNTNKIAADTIYKNILDFKNQQDLTQEQLDVLDARTQPLSVDDELKLINFYAKKVQVISQHLNLPTEIIATSISFFKKFFLENSVMQYDPKSLVHTTIFLACKAENYFISVDSFAKKAKPNREAILKYEFKLLESLKFSLLIHHPYKPLHGFFLDIQNVLHGKVDLNYMGQTYDKCKKKITEAILTDVVYLFTPPQITLAILMIEDEALITKYLELKFSVNSEKKNNDTISFSTLLTIINDCKSFIQEEKSVSTDDARKIAAQNFFCQNPMDLIQRMKRKQPEEETTASPEKKPRVA